MLLYMEESGDDKEAKRTWSLPMEEDAISLYLLWKDLQDGASRAVRQLLGLPGATGKRRRRCEKKEEEAMGTGSIGKADAEAIMAESATASEKYER
jgi:hypothetical protein